MTVEFVALPATAITPDEETAIQALVTARRSHDVRAHLRALDALGEVAHRSAERTMLLLDVARVVEAALDDERVLVDALPAFPC